MHTTSPTSLVQRWSVWLTSFLHGLWVSFVGGCLGQPPHRDQLLYRLLLAEVKTQEFFANLAQTLHRGAVRYFSLHQLELEEAAGGERHNEGVEGGPTMQEEYPVQSILTYYVAELLPGVIALTRYHAMDDHDRTLAVAEDIFFDTAEDFCRLQNEVEDSLMHGFDVCVISPHAPDTFEDINKFLEQDDDSLNV